MDTYKLSALLRGYKILPGLLWSSQRGPSPASFHNRAYFFFFFLTWIDSKREFCECFQLLLCEVFPFCPCERQTFPPWCVWPCVRFSRLAGRQWVAVNWFAASRWSPPLYRLKPTSCPSHPLSLWAPSRLNSGGFDVCCWHKTNWAQSGVAHSHSE